MSNTFTQSQDRKSSTPGAKFGSKKIKFFLFRKILKFTITRSYYYTDYFKSNYAIKICQKLFLNSKVFYIKTYIFKY